MGNLTITPVRQNNKNSLPINFKSRIFSDLKINEKTENKKTDIFIKRGPDPNSDASFFTDKNPLKKKFQPIIFKGKLPSAQKAKKTVKKTLSRVDIKTPKKRDPVSLPGVSFFMAEKIIECSNKLGMCIDDYLRANLKHLTYIPRVIPEPSKTANVGKTKVTTLIDGEQIFDKTVEYIKSAEESIQVEMFEFQNLKIDGHKWPTNGAEIVPGAEKQQKLLDMLLKKKKENPKLKVQVILDAHKWYINGHGERDRHYGNQDMIKYLKQNDIDVVPYPRPAQKGSALQHVKMLAVDSKKVIIGGMNWGTHSAANHDACVAIETHPRYKHSEVDNIIDEIFNRDWAFSWQRLGNTKLIAGPLTEEEQVSYTRLKKEIKQENVDYMDIVGKLFDNPENKNRYKEGRLDMVPVKPVANPKIQVLVTKPKEMAFVEQEGLESTRKLLMDRVKNAEKLRAELFVLSDKELIETIAQRHKKKELDAKFIVESSILEEFPYCRNAYDTLVQNGVPVRLYKSDPKTNQRMHAKWAVFDDDNVVIGSTNWSAMGLNSNLQKGHREDYELHVQKINGEIRKSLASVEEHEREIGIPPLKQNKFDYKRLLARRKKMKKAIKDLKETGNATIEIKGQEYHLTDEQLSGVHTVQGYYKNIKDRHNAKEKYKRGNNECAVSFKKPSLAKVFLRQFEKDWKHSESSFEKIKERELKAKLPIDERAVDIVG